MSFPPAVGTRRTCHRIRRRLAIDRAAASQLLRDNLEDEPRGGEIATRSIQCVSDDGRHAERERHILAEHHG